MMRKQTGRLFRRWLHKIHEKSWSSTSATMKPMRQRTASPNLGLKTTRRNWQNQRSMVHPAEDTNDSRLCSRALLTATFCQSSLPLKAPRPTIHFKYTQVLNLNQIGESQELLCSVSSKRPWTSAYRRTEWRTLSCLPYVVATLASRKLKRHISRHNLVVQTIYAC
jgi:hypothetical protein